MPVIADSLAHTFWANVHLATVHAHNGKMHVHYELRKITDEDGKTKGTPKHEASEETDQLPAAAISLPAAPYSLHVTGPGYCGYLMPHYTLAQGCDYPPPRAA